MRRVQAHLLTYLNIRDIVTDKKKLTYLCIYLLTHWW